MLELPARYEAQWRLGQGGGGEVWAVRDRVTGQTLAFKALTPGARDEEAQALVREAIALSGLEGLGVPRVVAFGALADGRRYMVRELVEGTSLADVLEASVAADAAPSGGRAWLVPLARAADQLTALHRAGLLHGDVKPANVIVGKDGQGTLVDLGLAAPWQEGGTRARGLTPRYAAPELLAGEPLTVRAEVYALGATLAEGLARRGGELEDDARLDLARVAARATEADPQKRFPSADEVASAIRSAAHLGPAQLDAAAWPVVATEAPARALLDRARTLRPGDALVVVGPPGSGRSTFARRLLWTLGIEGRPVVLLESPTTGMSRAEAVDLELGTVTHGALAELVILVDDAEELDDGSRAAIARAAKAGARLVIFAETDVSARGLSSGATEELGVTPLPEEAAVGLVRRSMPSLSEPLAQHLVRRTHGWPGTLRQAVRRLAGRAVVSKEEIDLELAEERSPLSRAMPPSSRAEQERSLEELLATGRTREALAVLERLGEPQGTDERIRFALARARILTASGEPRRALELLAREEQEALGTAWERELRITQARSAIRAGDYPLAMRQVLPATKGDDALAAEALAALGVAQALTGDDASGEATLLRAVDLARRARSARAEGLGLGSLAIVHQRLGRLADAKRDYEGSLEAATRARDAATIMAAHLNLAGLAQGEGDLGGALRHLEAAVDMGRRVGATHAVVHAELNLASVELYLGRYARARASIDALRAGGDVESAVARAQLLGLEAELLAKTGDRSASAERYARCAEAWESQGRALEAAEARLEGMLTRPLSAADVPAVEAELRALEDKLGTGGFQSHEPLALLVRGTLRALAERDDEARKLFGDAWERAVAIGQKEHAWWALEARARLHLRQGNATLARRDVEAALALLEEIASKLPRDLREVFWDDPRRKALRQLDGSTHAGPVGRAAPLPGAASSSQGDSRHVPLPAEDRLARVFAITREIATEHDLSRLLSRVTDHAIALLGGERGFVVLVGPGGELEVHAARDRKGDEPHARFSRSVAEQVIATGEPVVTTSAGDDARLAQAVSVHQLMIQSVACVPVRGAPPALQPIGALYVETRLRKSARFEAEIPTLLAFADQAAIAIGYARLLAENQKKADELAAANAELAEAKERLAELLEQRTEQLAEVRRDLRQARAELRGKFGYAGLVGTSAAMRKVYALIDRVKDTDVPVLITGESGTGKEVVARAIHQTSPRAKKAFLGVNCGAIPANLLESELFGHVRGAFTGAERDRKGLFREAEGGTILLDEIGEMPLKMQPSLLRALQEKTVRPVGGTREEAFDARIITATNRDLAAMVQEGTFREDLYYRLHVVELRVPALRERAEDIPPLIDHFLTLFSSRYKRERKSVEKVALRKLMAYHWPGNVRQLEHVLLNAWLMSEGKELVLADFTLPEAGPPLASPERGTLRPAKLPKSDAEFRDTEKERILRALAACNWNRVQAAKLSGIPRRTFYRRLKEFGIL
jgi:transcriptional regulator with GAF, ATPase, and Fis domain/energy-coupling factor transporter ATP-binding protein EcfA2